MYIEVVWHSSPECPDKLRIWRFFSRYGLRPREEYWQGWGAEVELRQAVTREYDDRGAQWPLPLVVLKNDEGKVVWADGNPSDTGLLHMYHIMEGGRAVKVTPLAMEEEVPCTTCGSPLVWNGPLYKCLNCGASGGSTNEPRKR